MIGLASTIIVHYNIKRRRICRENNHKKLEKLEKLEKHEKHKKQEKHEKDIDFSDDFIVDDVIIVSDIVHVVADVILCDESIV
jgi:hypothetical protein